MKVAGRWRDVYRAIDEQGQIVDVYVSERRDTTAARRFFAKALAAQGDPNEVVTDRAWSLAVAIDELMPGESPHRAVCEQSDRWRPWAPQGAAPTDARTQTRPDRERHYPGPRVDAERSARSLRTRSRRAVASSSRGRVHRTRPHHLSEGGGPHATVPRQARVWVARGRGKGTLPMTRGQTPAPHRLETRRQG